VSTVWGDTLSSVAVALLVMPDAKHRMTSRSFFESPLKNPSPPSKRDRVLFVACLFSLIRSIRSAARGQTRIEGIKKPLVRVS